MRIVGGLFAIAIGLLLIWGRSVPWRMNSRLSPGVFKDPDPDSRRWFEAVPIFMGVCAIACGIVIILAAIFNWK